MHNKCFFKKLSEMLRNYANSLISIGGDFNCPLSNEDKKSGQDLSSKKNVITLLAEHICSMFRLCIFFSKKRSEVMEGKCLNVKCKVFPY